MKVALLSTQMAHAILARVDIGATQMIMTFSCVQRHVHQICIPCSARDGVYHATHSGMNADWTSLILVEATKLHSTMEHHSVKLFVKLSVLMDGSRPMDGVTCVLTVV